MAIGKAHIRISVEGNWLHMNQYLIEAYASPHDGRTRRHYLLATTVEEAAGLFHQQHPDRVIRNIWKHIPPSYYSETPIPDTTKEHE